MLRLVYSVISWIMLWGASEIFIRKHNEKLDFSYLGDIIAAIMYQPLLYFLILGCAFLGVYIIKRNLLHSLRMMVNPMDSIKLTGLVLFSVTFYSGLQGYLYFPNLSIVLFGLVIGIDIALYVTWQRGKKLKLPAEVKKEWS